MSKKLTITCTAVVALAAANATPARAHFILVKPDSWLNEDQSAFGGGAPQKMGPCGPGGQDDIQPEPDSGKVTTVHVGDTLHVEWQVTIPHDGYFRISLAKDRSEFTEPHFADPVACSFDDMSMQTGAHDNVLMDGIDPSATGQDIMVPDMPCDKCTLQVIQVMKDHGPPNCTYYHCADLQILGGDGGGTGGMGAAGAGAGSGGMGAAGSGAGGMSGMTGSGGMMSTSGSGGMGAMSGSGGTGTTMGFATGSGGTGATVTPTGTGSGGAPAMTGSGGGGVISDPGSSSSKSGCAVSEPGARDARTALWLAIGFGLIALQRRRRA